MPDFLAQAVVGANGKATCTVEHNLPAKTWEIQQVSVVTGTSTSGTVALFKNSNLVAPTAVFVPLATGAGITAGGLPYVYLEASDALTAQCYGLTAGDTLTIRAQYREFSSSDPLQYGMG